MRSKVRAYSHQGHGPRADQQAGYISASPIPPPHLRRAAGSLIAASASSKFALSCPGHGSLRGQQQLPHHLVRPEALALQGPQRAYDLITCPPAARAIACTLALGRSCVGVSDESMTYAAALACGAQRNGSPDRQTLCRITESLRAKATRALPEPERRSIASAQSFR